VPYERGRRLAGASKFSYMAYVRLAWDAITSFSHVPLKIVSALGLAMSVIALLGIVFYFGLFFVGMVEAKGFTTLILVILFLSGTQLLCLGILGEYIDRIFDEVKARPRSIVTSSCGFAGKVRSA
jgi:dolichol-phosphate mannosyltransferase